MDIEIFLKCNTVAVSEKEACYAVEVRKAISVCSLKPSVLFRIFICNEKVLLLC